MDESTISMARLACHACRRQKRKCTRELPTCELCRRNHRQCEYSSDSLSPNGDDVITASPQSVQARSSFPPLFFLDSFIFGARRATVQLPSIPLPQDLHDFVNIEGERLFTYVAEYFQSSHRILPFVSKHRFLRRLSSGNQLDADTALLLLCMHMVGQPGDPTVYSKAKQCLFVLESQGLISVQLLQSSILIGMYEISNAIHPAAFLSVAHSARLGQAMGMHDRRNAPPMFPMPRSWTEVEEIRRTWWAVIVLDRYVSLGVENRPFSCEDARAEDVLPTDESRWEQGVRCPSTSSRSTANLAKEPTTTPSLAVSADTSLAASPYARTCQATHLLSRVVSHMNTNAASSNRAAYYSQALQLHQILSAFHTVIFSETMQGDAEEFTAMSSAMGICFSAMISLYDTHSCADLDDISGVGIPEQLSMQTASLEGLQNLVASVCQFASKLRDFSASDPLKLPANPFITESLYSAAKQIIWYLRETGKTDHLGLTDILLNSLRLIGQNLHVANEYIAILDGDGFQRTD